MRLLALFVFRLGQHLQVASERRNAPKSGFSPGSDDDLVARTPARPSDIRGHVSDVDRRAAANGEFLELATGLEP